MDHFKSTGFYDCQKIQPYQYFVRKLKFIEDRYRDMLQLGRNSFSIAGSPFSKDFRKLQYVGKFFVIKKKYSY